MERDCDDGSFMDGISKEIRSLSLERRSEEGGRRGY
jgi:hypothetical protein